MKVFDTTWKEPTNTYVYDNNSWKQPTKTYIYNNNAWKDMTPGP